MCQGDGGRQSLVSIDYLLCVGGVVLPGIAVCTVPADGEKKRVNLPFSIYFGMLLLKYIYYTKWLGRGFSIR